MMAVITPSDACDTWRFSPEDICRGLKEKWSQATIVKLPRPTVSYSQRWIITMSSADYPLSGHAGNQNKALVFDGKVADCASFALWVRAITPPHVELLMWDDKNEPPLPLTSDTIADDIVHHFENLG